MILLDPSILVYPVGAEHPLRAACRQVVGAFDAVLAAVAQRREHVRGLASADAAFSGIPTLVHLNPADDDFAARLGIA